MGFSDRLDVEVLDNPPPTGVAELLRKGRAFEQPLDGFCQSVWIAGRHEQPGGAIDDQLGHPTHVRGDHRQPGCHRFENGERKAFRVRREHEDIGCGEQFRNVGPLAEKANDRAESKVPDLILDRSSLRAVTNENGLEVPAGHQRKGADEGDRILRSLQASDHDESQSSGLRLCDVESLCGNAVADDDRAQIVASACHKARLAFVLGYAHGDRRQGTKSPLDPSICSGSKPSVGQKRPAVHRVHPNGNAGEPSRETTEGRRLRTVDVYDVGLLSPQNPEELEQAEKIVPWADRAPDVMKRDKPRARRLRRLLQRPIAVRRNDDVKGLDEWWEQGRDISLSPSRLGQRNQEHQSWTHHWSVSR
jgi:hypothetical protein